MKGIRFLTEQQRSQLHRFGTAAAKLLYPDRCPLCGEIADGICERCRPQLKRIGQPRCFRCGKPLADGEAEYCADCRDGRHRYVQGRGILAYEGAVKEAVHQIKYGNQRAYLDPFADLMACELAPDLERWQPEALIPIPMFPKRQKARGYNQAQLLAERLGKRLNLPVDTGTLRKIRDTGDQKELSREARRRNLRGAFAADGGCPWKRVLLVDDVYTTGSTIDAAAEALENGGAGEVYFATICIGQGDR